MAGVMPLAATRFVQVRSSGTWPRAQSRLIAVRVVIAHPANNPSRQFVAKMTSSVACQDVVSAETPGQNPTQDKQGTIKMEVNCEYERKLWLSGPLSSLR
jgi:hypothetical protein